MLPQPGFYLCCLLSGYHAENLDKSFFLIFMIYDYEFNFTSTDLVLTRCAGIHAHPRNKLWGK